MKDCFSAIIRQPKSQPCIQAFVETRTFESKKLTPLIQNSDQPRVKARIRLPLKIKDLEQDFEILKSCSILSIRINQEIRLELHYILRSKI